MKLLGIDYGEKRVGIAISDSDGKIAFPFTILENSKKLSDDIKTICVKESVVGIVIGESLDYNNQENSIMPKVRALKIVL